MRCAERLHYGAVLLDDELRGLLHDVPPHQGTVCDQTLHHLQHVRGTTRSCFLLFLSDYTVPPVTLRYAPLLCCQVADRLFSSFGQDILDALYWTATEPKEKKRAHIGVIPHFLMAVLYVCILTEMKMDCCRQSACLYSELLKESKV